MDLSKFNCFIDLHLHLDGSLSIASVRELAAKQNIEVPEGEQELRSLLECPAACNDLNDYLKCFDFPLQLLQTTEALTLSVKTLVDELKQEGIIYAEIRFAPQLHCQKGLTMEDVIQAAIKGLPDTDAGIRANLILCCMRGMGNTKENEETVRLAAKYLGEGVAAVDLAGAEALYQTSQYADLFALARTLQVPFTIHAGEAAGAESVSLAVSYGAKRIGHGVRSYENEELLSRLRDLDIALELCPTSNLDTRVITDLKEYPLLSYYKQGIPVTINTDNRTVSNTTVRREFELIAQVSKLTKQDIEKLLLTAVKYSFADEGSKHWMKEKITEEFCDQ